MLTVRRRTQNVTSTSRDRQASLIAAATSLFAARGFRGTRTKEISKAAGVSEALLFKYFPTTRALYAAILAEKANLSALVGAIDDVARKRDDQRLAEVAPASSFRLGSADTQGARLRHTWLRAARHCRKDAHGQCRVRPRAACQLDDDGHGVWGMD